MRADARGLKKYPFAGSGTGGKAAAIACSLIETAKLNGADPTSGSPTPSPESRIAKSTRSTTCSLGAGTGSGRTGRLRQEDQGVAFGAQQAGRMN